MSTPPAPAAAPAVAPTGDASGRPRAVAIITDGNGRWATQRGLPVLDGHRQGADVVKARLRDAAALGIEEFTVYSFSTENWRRSPEEVEGPIAAGERVGSVTVLVDGEPVRRVALVTAEDVPGAGTLRVLLSVLGVPLTLLIAVGILVAAILAILRVRVRIRIAR